MRAKQIQFAYGDGVLDYELALELHKTPEEVMAMPNKHVLGLAALLRLRAERERRRG